MLACCGQSSGYRGPLPTSQARQHLTALWGKTLPAGSVAFTSKEVTLLSCVVGPSGPLVMVEEAGEHKKPSDGRHRIPVLTDGDIEDLFQRATGEGFGERASPRASSEPVVWELSDAYRRKMTGK